MVYNFHFYGIHDTSVSCLLLLCFSYPSGLSYCLPQSFPFCFGEITGIACIVFLRRWCVPPVNTCNIPLNEL